MDARSSMRMRYNSRENSYRIIGAVKLRDSNGSYNRSLVNSLRELRKPLKTKFRRPLNNESDLSLRVPSFDESRSMAMPHPGKSRK